MANLGTKSMEGWYELLPKDIASSMDRPTDDGSESSAVLIPLFETVNRGEDILEIVEKNYAHFLKIGRARRIRFLAWVAARPFPEARAVIIRLSDDESDGGESPIGKVAPVFKADIRALAASLGPRMARGIVDTDVLDTVYSAGIDVFREMEMPNRGVA